jgi:tetratricopeptide (TPR) repeat protein
MNTSETFLNQMKQFHSRIDTLSKRTSRQFGFVLVLLLVTAVALVVLLHRYSIQIMDRIDAIPIQSASQSELTPSATIDSYRIQALESRLAALEQLQEAMLSASKGALEQMNFVFGVVAAFFGLFGLYFAYRQTMSDTTQDTYDQEMRGLVGSFRENMNVINSLIATMEKGFEHRAAVDRQISQIETNLRDVEKFKTDTQRTFQEKIAALNQEAWTLFGSLNRENFKDEANRGRLDNYYVSMNATEQIGDVHELLSPFTYFTRALHFFNVTQYPMASRDLERARSLSAKQVSQPPMLLYADIGEADIRERLGQLLTECCYHLGIIYYNLGSYDQAKQRFSEAYTRNPSDLRSRAYIPELMFFAGRQSFGAIMDEFDMAEREFKAWLTKDDRGKVNLDGNLASLLMRRGNCYLPKIIHLQDRGKYRHDENADTSIRTYANALVHATRTITDASKPPLTEIFVRFSLAQAMTEAQQKTFENLTREGLFTDVFYDLLRQVSMKSEPIVLTLLNYALAICAAETNVPNENSSFYLSRAREHLTRVPPEVRVFSPINKINLTREEILAEMDEFERLVRR